MFCSEKSTSYKVIQGYKVGVSSYRRGEYCTSYLLWNSWRVLGLLTDWTFIYVDCRFYEYDYERKLKMELISSGRYVLELEIVRVYCISYEFKAVNSNSSKW